MTSGLRVAKGGHDATRGVGRDLAFTSETQSLKISDEFKDKIRVINLTTPTGVIVHIIHSLGYAPVFRLFVESPPFSGLWYNDSYSADLLTDPAVNPNVTSWKVVDIGDTVIQIFFGTSGTVGQPVNFRFKYWIFEDRLKQL